MVSSDNVMLACIPNIPALLPSLYPRKDKFSAIASSTSNLSLVSKQKTPLIPKSSHTPFLIRAREPWEFLEA